MFAFINRKLELQALQDSFSDQVIRDNSCLSYLVQGREGVGKTRLVHEFIDNVESDKRIASFIPKFQRRVHVFEYECKKEVTGAYQAFVEISKQIKQQRQAFRILKQVGMLAISFLPIHDIIEDFIKLGDAINSGEEKEAIRNKEIRIFRKYLRTLKHRSQRAPIIIYIRNIQWIDDHSLELLRTLIETRTSIWGMIILEQNEVSTKNLKLNAMLKRLVERKKLSRLKLRSMRKGFEVDMLESRFGTQLFTAKEYEHIYTICEGNPGLLADLAEEWIRKGWLHKQGDCWQKIEGFENKIKAPHQKLLDLLITMLDDGAVSPKERRLINNFAEEWGVSAEIVSRMTDMLLKTMESGYTLERRVHSGAIGKDAFLAIDDANNRCLVEYVGNLRDIDQNLIPREVRHPHLLSAREIKKFQDGALIVNEYLEGKTLKEIKIEAFDSHIESMLKIAVQIADGLAELHRNNSPHGHLLPECIIVSDDGNVHLTGLDAAQLERFMGSSNNLDRRILPYSSPEYINGDRVDARSDVFSFGILIYEMLTGELPFQGRTEDQLKQAIQFEDVPPFDHIKARIPDEVQAFIVKCLKKDSNQRYQDAGQLVEQLQELMTTIDRGEGEPIPKEIQPIRPQSKKRRLLVPSVVTILFIILLGLVLHRFYFAEIPPNLVKAIHVEDISGFNRINHKTLTSEMMKYLIIDDLMKATDKTGKHIVVLDTNDFDRLYPSRTPMLSVGGSMSEEASRFFVVFRASRVGYDGHSKEMSYDFTDPSALLTSIIPDLTGQILTMYDPDHNKKKSISTTSWDAFVSFCEGEEAWRLLNITDAEQKYREALDIDPVFVLAKLRRAEVLRFQGSIVHAQELVSDVNDHLDELSYINMLKAEALNARLGGNWRGEIKALREIYNAFPMRKESPYDVAEAYYAISDIKNAIDYYSKAIALDPDFARAHNHIAYCYSHLGNHAKAIEHFQNYVKLDGTANAHDSLADGYMAAGRLDKAVEEKQLAIELDPQLAYLYGSLCYIRVRQGKVRDARRMAEKFIELSSDPDSQSGGYFRLAYIEYFHKNYDHALELALEGRRIFDSNDIVTRGHGLHWLLGLVYLETDRIEEAERELDQMQTLIHDHQITETNYYQGLYKYALHLQACLAAKRNNLAEVLEIIREFDGPIKDKIKDNTSHFDLSFFNTHFGEVLLKSFPQCSDLAIDRFEKALEYNENYDLANYHLWKLGVEDPNDPTIRLARAKSAWGDADTEFLELFGISETVRPTTQQAVQSSFKGNK
ncbi:protein kinase [Planctomycetota bacterium]